MNPWDERYSKDDYHYGTQLNDFLKANAERLLTGQNSPKVLCLADGEGSVCQFIGTKPNAI